MEKVMDLSGGVTFVHMSSESSDHYYFVFPGMLSEIDARAKAVEELGEEGEYCYLEYVEVVVPQHTPRSMLDELDSLVTGCKEVEEPTQQWIIRADLIDAWIEKQRHKLDEPPAKPSHPYKESGGGFCARCDDMPGEGEHA